VLSCVQIQVLACYARFVLFEHTNNIQCKRQRQATCIHLSYLSTKPPILFDHINVIGVSEVEKAIKALDSRYFAGRLVRAQPFDQAMFDANDLSG